MTPDQIKQVAKAMLADLEGYSEYRYIPDDDPYKPYYRATAILLGGGKTSLPSKMFGLNRPVTLDEAKAILTEAHPYFAEHIKADPEHYAEVYGFHHETWSDEYFWRDE